MTEGAVEEKLTVSQAARLAGVSSERIRQLADSGRLPALRTPLGRLFERSDIETFIASRATRGATRGAA